MMDWILSWPWWAQCPAVMYLVVGGVMGFILAREEADDHESTAGDVVKIFIALLLGWLPLLLKSVLFDRVREPPRGEVHH